MNWDKHKQFEHELDKQGSYVPSREELYVLWSGGCDSTALLYYLAHRYPSCNIKAISVIQKYITSCKCDYEARKRLKQRFDTEGLNISYFTYHVKNEIPNSFAGLSQPLIWLSTVPNLLTQVDKAICFGYIRHDDVWHYKQYFENIFNDMNKICCGSQYNELWFPFEWISKDIIVKYLKDNDLFDLISYCEHEVDRKPCGKCNKCIEMKHVLENLNDNYEDIS